MKELLTHLSRSLFESVRDLLPIIGVIGFFQLVVLRQPIPNFAELVIGTLLVVVGLTLFVHGLKTGLFPIGESMAHDFARKGSLSWLLLFAFCLGFGTTVAEPALIAVADEAAEIAADGGMIAAGEAAKLEYAAGLRITVAVSVGFAILIGVLRIIRGWPLPAAVRVFFLPRLPSPDLLTSAVRSSRFGFGFAVSCFPADASGALVGFAAAPASSVVTANSRANSPPRKPGLAFGSVCGAASGPGAGRLGAGREGMDRLTAATARAPAAAACVLALATRSA